MPQSKPDLPEYVAVYRPYGPKTPGEPDVHVHHGGGPNRRPDDWMVEFPKGVFSISAKAAGEQAWFRGCRDDMIQLRDAVRQQGEKEWGTGQVAGVSAKYYFSEQGLYEGFLFAERRQRASEKK